MRFDLTLSVAQQRFLALALALLPLFAATYTLGWFVSEQVIHHAHVSLLARELAHEHAVLKAAPAWETRFSTIKSSPLWQNLFITQAPGRPGPRQNRLVQIVRQTGATVLQSTTSESRNGGAVQIEESVSFTADIQTLTRVLVELRKGPLFVLRTLRIHDQEGGAPRTAPNQLHIDLAVTGFARPT